MSDDQGMARTMKEWLAWHTKGESPEPKDAKDIPGTTLTLSAADTARYLKVRAKKMAAAPRYVGLGQIAGCNLERLGKMAYQIPAGTRRRARHTGSN